MHSISWAITLRRSVKLPCCLWFALRMAGWVRIGRSQQIILNICSTSLLRQSPAPKQIEGTPQMLITSLDYSEATPDVSPLVVYTVEHWRMDRILQSVTATEHRNALRLKELHTIEGMGHKKTDAVDSGDICAVIGLEKFEIGDSVLILRIQNHCHQSLLMSHLWVCSSPSTTLLSSERRSSVPLVTLAIVWTRNFEKNLVLFVCVRWGLSMDKWILVVSCTSPLCPHWDNVSRGL